MSDDDSGCGCCGFGPVGIVGTVIASIQSWTAHHSWYMAIGHGILSWFYVLYHWAAN